VYSWAYSLKVFPDREAGEEEEDELGRMLDDPSTDPDTVNKLVMPCFFFSVFEPATFHGIDMLLLCTTNHQTLWLCFTWDHTTENRPSSFSLHRTELVMFDTGRWSDKRIEAVLC
jgi:hypothetical protein